jgi:hypothetical protein
VLQHQLLKQTRFHSSQPNHVPLAVLVEGVTSAGEMKIHLKFSPAQSVPFICLFPAVDELDEPALVGVVPDLVPNR